MSKSLSTISSSRFDEEGDWIVRQFVTPDDLRLEPEEYVARHAHSIGSFSFHLYRFSDPALESWVRRVGQLLASEKEVQRCQEQFLTPCEAETVRQQGCEDL